MFIMKNHLIIVALFLITNVDFSAENDLGGHHFNYLVFDVMCFVLNYSVDMFH